MLKFFVGAVCIYAFSIGTILPLKRYITRNPKASICLVEVIAAPILVPFGIVIALMERADTVCVMGCE